MPATARVAIRQLTQADLAAYRALMLEAYDLEPAWFTATRAERAAMPTSWWRQRIADPQGRAVGFGAFGGTHLAGAVAMAFGPGDACARKASLRGLYVQAPMRGLGLGRALLEVALAHARACGARVVELGVVEGNDAARGLYRAAGFVPFRHESVVGELRSRAVEHVWCRLDLPPAEFSPRM